MPPLTGRVTPVLRVLLGPLLLLIAWIPGLRWLARRIDAVPTAAPVPVGPSGQPDPAAARDAAAVAHTQSMREAMEKIRTSLAAYGGAIGVASGGLIAVTSWTTFGDLFPLPVFPGSAHPVMLRIVLWGLAVILPVTAIVCSATLTSWFFRAQRRIVVDSRFLETNGASAKKFPAVKSTLDAALEPDEEELVRYRLAEVRRSSQEAQRPVTEAELSDALVTGAATVLEKRSADLYGRPRTVVLACAGSLAVAGMFALGHWSAGQRERITDWTGCLKDAASSAQCAQLDPLPLPTGTPASSPTSAYGALNDCASSSPSPTAGISSALRDRALAACAGLPSK